MKYIITLSLLIFSLPLSAQSSGIVDSFSLPANMEPLKVESWWLGKDDFEPGERLPVTAKVSLDEDYNAYENKIKITALEPKGVDVSEVIISPLVGFVDFAGKQHAGVHKEAQLKFFIEIPKNIPKKVQFKFELEYVACTNKICLPKKKVIFGQLDTNGDKAQQDNNSSSEFSEQVKDNIVLAFLLVFLFGFLTSLTPCVYPLIPITLAVIGSRAKDANRLQAFLLSLVYVLGIAATYSTLGVIAAKTGALFGQALSYPPVVIAFAVLFFIMALSLFGYFEIRAPHFITNKLSNQKNGSGFVSAFFSGLIAGIVASPCVGPVLVGVLAYIAQTQNTLLGFALLFTFAMGMGVLFIALGTFSSFINKIPKSGNWMDLIKYAMGFTMFGLCAYYLEPILTKQQMGFLIAFLFFISGRIIFFGFKDRFKKISMALLLLCSVAGGYFAAQAIMSPKKTASEIHYKNGWQAYSEAKINEAKASGQPVIIDFYADWCVACVELDEKTFTKPEVIKLSKNFMLLKVDATETFEGLMELQKKYGVYGLPTIIFLKPNGLQNKEVTLTGFEEAPHFLQRMQSALE